MRILGLDLETTGLLTPDHRIVEIYMGVWDSTTRKQTWEYDQRIDPVRSIALDAQRVHGISSTMLVGKPKWEDVAWGVSKNLNAVDLIVAHNGDGFDIPFINQEMQRVGAPSWSCPTFDTMVSGRHSTPNGKVPNLGELCFAYDIPYDPALAHAASYDVRRMMECFFKGVDQGFFQVKGPSI